MPVVVASSGFSVNFESHDMADDTTKRDRRDHSRVNMRDDYDRQYWRRRFGRQ